MEFMPQAWTIPIQSYQQHSTRQQPSQDEGHKDLATMLIWLSASPKGECGLHHSRSAWSHSTNLPFPNISGSEHLLHRSQQTRQGRMKANASRFTFETPRTHYLVHVLLLFSIKFECLPRGTGLLPTANLAQSSDQWYLPPVNSLPMASVKKQRKVNHCG